ncbi:hypothetical protein BC830DRAFT_1167987 [Chytriomyces sp. MP71]|nr:hypothetical protein BC830DRAFT_1167987 [Chytriomyces sp. MP71]
MLASVPNGCLLVQAGRKLDHLTGGRIVAGFHDVVIVDSTLAVIKRQKAARRPLWRISSTLFFYIASDNLLDPVPHFATDENVKQYPPIFLTGPKCKKSWAS